MYTAEFVARKVAAHEHAQLDRLQRRWRRRARRWGFSTPIGQAALMTREIFWEARNVVLGEPGSQERLAVALAALAAAHAR